METFSNILVFYKSKIILMYKVYIFKKDIMLDYKNNWWGTVSQGVFQLYICLHLHVFFSMWILYL